MVGWCAEAGMYLVQKARPLDREDEPMALMLWVAGAWGWGRRRSATNQDEIRPVVMMPHERCGVEG